MKREGGEVSFVRRDRTSAKVVTDHPPQSLRARQSYLFLAVDFL